MAMNAGSPAENDIKPAIVALNAAVQSTALSLHAMNSTANSFDLHTAISAAVNEVNPPGNTAVFNGTNSEECSSNALSDAVVSSFSTVQIKVEPCDSASDQLKAQRSKGGRGGKRNRSPMREEPKRALEEWGGLQVLERKQSGEEVEKQKAREREMSDSVEDGRRRSGRRKRSLNNTIQSQESTLATTCTLDAMQPKPVVTVKRGNVINKDGDSELSVTDNVSEAEITEAVRLEKYAMRYTLPIGGPSSLHLLQQSQYLRKRNVLHDRCLECLTDHNSSYVRSDGTSRVRQCKIYSPSHTVEDNAVQRNTVVSSLHTLPKELCICPSDEDNKLRVYAAEDIEAFTRFGPVQGEVLHDRDIETMKTACLENLWFMPHSTQAEATYQYTANETKSNWCCYVRQGPLTNDYNMAAIAKDHQIFLVSTQTITPGEELVCTVPYFGSHDKMYDKECINTRCSQCRIDYENPLLYHKHYWIDHPYGIHRCTMKYPCSICGEILYNRNQAERHSKEQHGWVDKGFKCEECGKHLTTYRGLLVHKENAHSTDRRKWKCTLCAKKFPALCKLKSHMSDEHPTDRSVLRCSMCNKTFASVRGVKRHHHIHAETGYRAACEVCGKKFRDFTNLKVHLLTHSGVRPFQCGEVGCRHAFTTKQCLQLHYRKVHHYTNDCMPAITRAVPLTFDTRK